MFEVPRKELCRITLALAKAMQLAHRGHCSLAETFMFFIYIIAFAVIKSCKYPKSLHFSFSNIETVTHFPPQARDIQYKSRE